WTSLSVATRRQRENIFAHVMEIAGAEPFNAIRKKDIEAGKDRRRETPAQARHFLTALRGLFRWALESDHVKIDPTAGVKRPVQRKSEGFPVWTEEDIEAYYSHWPVGTRERVWIDVLIYTGLRRGDAVRLGKQHVRDGTATIKTEKSGFQTEVAL